MGMLSHIFLDHAADRTRGWRYAMGGDCAWLPVHPIGQPVARQWSERLAGVHQAPRAVPKPTISLSVLAHATVLVLVTLLVHSRMHDAARPRPPGVQLVFVAAPAPRRLRRM